MRYKSKILNLMFAVAVVATAIAAGCASAPLRTEATMSGIRATEKVGAAKLPKASLHLRPAKEELEPAKGLAQAKRAFQENPDSYQTRELANITKRKLRLTEVKGESRGVVITLSGSVLFASNQATLLPEARKRLDRVYDVLGTTRERHLIIEGHTDSHGSDSYNLDLSQRRADAVRNYLV